jgi:Ca2+-binding RTX toxin-like protein
MNRLYILLTVLVVMVGVPFFVAAHEALAEVLTGTDGEDTLVGTDRDDRLVGTDRDDRLTGLRGDDRLTGLREADRLWGGRGADHLWGGRGNDKIVPGYGDDVVYAGYGDDLIYARDTAAVDYIDCGPGFDQVETIHRDDKTLGNCERTLGPTRGDI